jgi:hypothetical protein
MATNPPSLNLRKTEAINSIKQAYAAIVANPANLPTGKTREQIIVELGEAKYRLVQYIHDNHESVTPEEVIGPEANIQNQAVINALVDTSEIDINHIPAFGGRRRKSRRKRKSRRNKSRMRR